MLLNEVKGQWHVILRQLAVGLIPALDKPGQHVPCPVHGGKDGFRVFKDVALSGGGVCNTCGVFPNGYLLLQWVNGWSKERIFDALLEFKTGVYSDAKTTAPSVLPSIKSKSKESHASPTDASSIALSWQSTWKESLPLSHSSAKPVQHYLAKRGLSLAFSSLHDMRFHPALPYYEGRQCIAEYPALLALVRDGEGNPITVHRTYLSFEGDKAPVVQPKKLMPANKPGATLGGAIRCLPFSSGKLAVAEGIETALAVSELIKIPCWATVSANGLRHFAIPPNVKCIAIMADIDRSETGQKAAQALAERAFKQGFAAQIHYPSYTHLLAFAKQHKSTPKSLDWLDVLNLETHHDFTF